MNSKLSIHPSSKLLVKIFGLNLLPDPEKPLPPHPWRSILQIAENRFNSDNLNTYLINLAAANKPEIWDLLGNPVVRSGLNPQPFPPISKYSQFVAETLIQKIETSVGLSTIFDNQVQVVKFWVQFLTQLPDDLCPEPKMLLKPKWWPPTPPSPWPAKHEDFSNLLILIASYLQYASISILNEELKVQLHSTGEKIFEKVQVTF